MPSESAGEKRSNVSKGLLRVVQRAMAAGVMIEMFRSVQEIALYCFVNNSLPRIRQHLYENLDRISSMEDALPIAERF